MKTKRSKSPEDSALGRGEAYQCAPNSASTSLCDPGTLQAIMPNFHALTQKRKRNLDKNRESGSNLKLKKSISVYSSDLYVEVIV
jgi:hypothetical protein